MPLVQATLKDALLDLMVNKKGMDPVAAAANWADAFDAYGSQVTNANGDGPLVPPNKAGFQAALAFLGLAPVTALEFATAWAAYFTGLTFVLGAPVAINGGPCLNVGGNSIFGVITTSLVTVVNPVPLTVALLAHFTTFQGSDPDAAANALATIFHSHTVNIANLAVVTSGLDTAGPVPIVNTCGVF